MPAGHRDAPHLESFGQSFLEDTDSLLDRQAPDRGSIQRGCAAKCPKDRALLAVEPSHDPTDSILKAGSAYRTAGAHLECLEGFSIAQRIPVLSVAFDEERFQVCASTGGVLVPVRYSAAN